MAEDTAAIQGRGAPAHFRRSHRPDIPRDGGVYYTVSIFEQQTRTSLALNIMDTDMNQEVLDTLRACVFGDELHAVFELRPKDKLYRLRLLRV